MRPEETMGERTPFGLAETPFTQRVLDGAARGANRHPVALIVAYSIGVLAVLGGVTALLIQHAR
jgi:hypothetical protein